VHPRKSLLQQQDPSSMRPQVLASNVDVLFIVTSANHDFNLNRLDRYVAMAFSGGIRPVILINKVELAENPVELIEQAAQRFVGVDVHAVSVYQRLNLKSLDIYAQPAHTLAFVGSSGVGKSSLTNYLLGEEFMQTSEVRESDSRGRHTTTHREMHFTKSGAVLIDTPGLRSVSLSDGDGLDFVFSDIEDLAQKCKFSDCSHTGEPGCAMNKALENGELSEERWQSYCKLQREVAFESRKQNKALLSEQKKQWAKRSQNAKLRLKDKGRKMEYS
jgi:ribosome biogenesis GTPase / thiamine phosphate phosphatase